MVLLFFESPKGKLVRGSGPQLLCLDFKALTTLIAHGLPCSISPILTNILLTSEKSLYDLCFATIFSSTSTPNMLFCQVSDSFLRLVKNVKIIQCDLTVSRSDPEMVIDLPNVRERVRT